MQLLRLPGAEVDARSAGSASNVVGAVKQRAVMNEQLVLLSIAAANKRSGCTVVGAQVCQHTR